MEELGYALRLARERRGLTQTQVMNLTGNFCIFKLFTFLIKQRTNLAKQQKSFRFVLCFCLLSIVMSRAEVSAMSSAAAAADAGAGDPVQIRP